MKLFSNILCLLSLPFLLVLASCSAKPAVSDTWLDEDFSGEQFRQILVIAVAERITFRNLFEGELVRQLEKKGIGAIPSYEILPYSDMLTRETVLSVVRNSDVDAVLITSLVDRTMKTVYYSLDGHNPYNYYNGLYREIRKPTKFGSYDIPILHLKTNLYDVHSEKLVWSITSESEYKYNIKSIDSAILLVINKLRENGFI